MRLVCGVSQKWAMYIMMNSLNKINGVGGGGVGGCRIPPGPLYFMSEGDSQQSDLLVLVGNLTLFT